ncbi:MAG TPA: hypothetical protein VGF50_12595 [Caulobacteraceae bacterium]|jgi:ribosomal protein S18 acetylase RimI-like enzyme
MTDTLPTAREAAATARPAVWADADAIAATLARAFHDDPLMCFLLPDAAGHPDKLQRLFRLLLRLGLPHGCCDVTTACEAVALWRPPGKWEIPAYQYVLNAGDFLGIFGLSGAARVNTTMASIEKRHPHDPHFYLQVLGTDTLKQGKGYGGVVIRRQLAAADAAHKPCYLESSKESNIPIYKSFGFEVTGEINLPGGPTLWPMWRPAKD